MTNQFVVIDGVAVIFMSRRFYRDEVYQVVIDAADLPLVASLPNAWGVCRQVECTCYAAMNVDGKLFLMHRVIIDCPSGLVTDHINWNGLDNRRSNLRAVTYSQNLKNRRPHGHVSHFDFLATLADRQRSIAA